MRFTAAALLCGAALAAGTLVAAQVVRPPAAWADGVDDKVAELKALEKSDEGKCIAKMQEYKDSGEPKIWAEIRSMALGSKSEKVAPAAVKMMANKPKPKDLEFLAKLVNKAEDKDLASRKDGRPEYFKAVLEGIAAYRDDEASLVARKKALPKLEDVVKKWITTDGEYAVRAIDAYATVPEKWTIDALLKWGEQMDSSGGGGGGGGGTSGGKGPSTETRKIMGESKTAIMMALGRLTGQDIGDMPSWRKWWTDNQKTFKFPAPGAVGADGAAAAPAFEPDSAEYKDAGYGFSVRKPAGESWTWNKPDYQSDETPRVMLKLAPPEQPEVGRAYFIIHPKRNPPPDVKGMIKWATEGEHAPFLTQIETDDDPKHKPHEEDRKICGVDAKVVVAMGQGKNQRSGFGSQERRYYFIDLGNTILYVDCVIRLGAEPEQKQALWEAIEGMNLPAAPKK